MSIGDKLARMDEIRQHRAELKRKDRALTEEFDAINAELLGQMDELGVESISGSGMTAYKTTTSMYRPIESDWGRVYKLIDETGYHHLLQRRLSQPAIRELVEMGQLPDGIMEVYDDIKLNVRKS